MRCRPGERARRTGRGRFKNRFARRGGVLFEVVLSIALFAGAAAFALGAVRSAFDKLDQTRRKQQAIDLARSKLAELEAGLITLADLRDGAAQQGLLPAGSNGLEDERQPETGPQWSFHVEVHRAPFAELSLIELTVTEAVPGAPEPAGSDGVRYTLRQLIKLRETDAEEFEDDPINQAVSHE